MPQEKEVERDSIIMNDAPLDDIGIDTSEFYGDGNSNGIVVEDKPERPKSVEGSSMNPEIQAELEAERAARQADREEIERFRQENETLRQSKVKESNDKLFFQKAFAEKTLTSINGDIKALERDLIAAKEDGRSDDEVRLQGELAEKRAEKAKVSEIYESIKDKKAEDFEDKSAAPKQNDPKAPPQAAKDWIAQNKWYEDQSKVENAKKKGVVEFIYGQIKKEGKLDDTKPEFYAELTRRFKMTDEGKDKTAPKKSSSVAGVSNDTSYSTRDGKTTVKLTQSDRDIMKALKINPNIKENVEEFARQKVASERRWERDEYDS